MIYRDPIRIRETPNNSP